MTRYVFFLWPGYEASSTPNVLSCCHLLTHIDSFHGAWLHFRRARVGVCVLCRMQASKESLPLVPKDETSCFSQGESPLYSCLLIAHLPSEVGPLIDIWKASITNAISWPSGNHKHLTSVVPI